jgi:Uri superfamily endonuclease
MQFTIFGENSREGTYILLIDLNAPVTVSFGKFQGGRAIRLEPGSYLYVGSALGSVKGRFPLASRLLRHASRSKSGLPHAIRENLLDYFMSMGYRPPAKKGTKKLHWHIDYLLDLPEAEIGHVFVYPGASRIEGQLALRLSSLPETSIVANRLGAQDAASGTHLFTTNDPAALLSRLKITLPG